MFLRGILTHPRKTSTTDPNPKKLLKEKFIL